MDYFSAFPKITYNGTTITDITIRLDFIQRIKSNLALFEYVQLQDGQRPEDIANIYYSDPSLYWIILYINSVIDPYYGWLLTDSQLFEYVKNKYGVDKVNSVNHYETTTQSDLGAGVWVNLGTPFCDPVTNMEYEQDLNEVKRKIKILKPSYISQVLSEYQKELR